MAQLKVSGINATKIEQEDTISCVSVTTRLSASGKSRYSQASKAQSIGSMVTGDFNGKKAKILTTLRGIDEMKSGICKTDVFLNLLDCLDCNISAEDMAMIQRKYSLANNGVSYLKYQNLLKALRFDNHTESWTLVGPGDQAAMNRFRTSTAPNNAARVSYEPTKSRLNATEL